MTATPRPGRAGLREAHAHVYSLGESLRMTDLARCPDLGACLELVAHAAHKARSAPRAGAPALARLHGARVEAWPQPRWPTLAELDRAADGVPVVILSFDHHAALANSAALRAAGLTPGLAVPPNGVVCVDDSGNATGLLLEQAAFRAWESAPEPDETTRRETVAAALRHLAALGFTEVHDLHSQSWLAPLLADMDRSGELADIGIRDVWLYPNIADAARAAWKSPSIRLGGFKVFLDGTLNSRTAWMLHPYHDPAPGLSHGKPMMTMDELRAAMFTAGDAGVGLAVHAIGDAAVRATLDAWEQDYDPVWPRFQEGGMPSLRIEHCELIDPADIPRFADLGVVCSVQPCHLLADVEALTRYLPHRLDRVLPLRELIAAGCAPGELLWFGSDVPIVRADPADSIRAAVERRRESTPQSKAIAWGQRISDADAWRAFQARCEP